MTHAENYGTLAIRLGKFKRTVDVVIWIARPDTRWHVYPSRMPRHLEATVLGVVYRRAPNGVVGSLRFERSPLPSDERRARTHSLRCAI